MTIKDTVNLQLENRSPYDFWGVFFVITKNTDPFLQWSFACSLNFFSFFLYCIVFVFSSNHISNPFLLAKSVFSKELYGM